MTPKPRPLRSTTKPLSLKRTFYPYDGSEKREDQTDFEYTDSYQVLISDDDDPSDRRTKSCYHLKWNQTLVPYEAYSNISNALRVEEKVAAFFKLGQQLIVAPPEPWQPDLDAMAKSAVSEFISDFSALTFVFEPISFKKVDVSSLDGLKHTRKIKVNYDNPLPDVSSGSSAVLSTNLGFLPFVSDLQAIYDRIHKWHEKLERLQQALDRGLRKVQSRNYTVSNTYDHGSNYRIKFVYRQKTLYGARFKGRVANSLYGPITRFNFAFDLATAWEFVPFSFLVDYVFPVGDVLANGFGLDSLYTDDSWYSKKIDVTVQVDYLAPYTDPTVDHLDRKWEERWVPIQFIDYTLYEREPLKFDVLDEKVVKDLFRVFKFPSMRRSLNLLALSFGRRS